MPSKVWGEISDPFLNFNGATVEDYDWISNFILLDLARLFDSPRHGSIDDAYVTYGTIYYLENKMVSIMFSRFAIFMPVVYIRNSGIKMTWNLAASYESPRQIALVLDNRLWEILSPK